MNSRRSGLPAGLKDAVQASRDADEIGLPLNAPVTAAPKRSAFRPDDRLTGMLIGCAIGDALGMPVEGIENELTQRALERLGGIRDFLAPQHHVLRSLRKLRPGYWTDDTQLTLAVARSVVAEGTLDYDAVADAHVRAFETLELRGWDATTKQACRRLAQGTSRSRSGKIGGSGNAVAMKISPVAAFSFVRGESRETLLRHCVAVGLMTHHDPRAVVGAYLVALLVRDGLASFKRWEPAADRYDELIDEAVWAEEALSRTLGVSDDPISQHLIELSDALDSTPAELAEFCHGATSYVCHSIPFVIALLCGRSWEFEDGVLAAVNAAGDTDTNGAIVGAILGGTYGLKRLPKRFLDKVEEAEMIRELGRSFGQTLGNAALMTA